MTQSDNSHDAGHSGCLESLIEVFQYIDGQLDKEREAHIDHHLDNCAKCYGRVNFHRILKDYVKFKGGQETASHSCLEAVHKILDPK